MGPMAPQRLSSLIGIIYDCAIDPERWPEALREIALELRCLLSTINLVKTWNYDIAAFAQETYGDELLYLIKQPHVMTQPRQAEDQYRAGRASHRSLIVWIF